MIAPVVIAAGISAAAALGSQALSSRSAAGATKQSRSFALHQGDIEWARQNKFRETEYQTRVEDAKKAGLHPLFAMGTGSNYTRTSSSPQPSGFSGSYAGSGLAEAGRAIASGVRGAGAAKREQELHTLRLQKMQREIMLDDAALMKAASDRKLAEQAALYWGDSQTGITGGSPQAKMYAYGQKTGPALNVRPLEASSRSTLPQYTELVGPKGRRQVLNQDSGLDEVAQVEYVARPWYEYVRSGFDNRFRPKMTSPKSYYYYWKNFYERKYGTSRKKKVR